MDIKFQVGDLVSDVDGNAVFVIVGRIRKSRTNRDKETFYDVYQVVQIYSLDEEEMFEGDLQRFEIKDEYLELRACRDTKEHDSETEDINAYREDLGYEVVEIKSLLTEYIDYESFKTIDECLDAMNDLDILYSTFGDKEYIDKKNKIMNYLTEKSKKLRKI